MTDLAHPFTTFFLLCVLARLGTQWWLASRHRRHTLAHRDRVPDAFADSITPADHRKAADYTVAKTRLGTVEATIAAVLTLAWTLGGGVEGLDQAWRSTGWPLVATGTAVLLSAFVVMGVLELPLSLYQTFVLEQRFGFNRTTMATFFGDELKQLLLLLLIGTPLVALVLWLMDASGGLWWLWVWGVWTGFTLLVSWLYPVIIAPMFNRFEPLSDASLAQRIESLLHRTGFRSRGVFVMDGSRRSGHGNAYFTGLGSNKRIVFFDTLLKNLDHQEIEAVLAHELGHYRLHHVIKRLVLVFAMSLAGLALLGYLAQTPWFYHALGVSQPSPHTALLLFMLALPPLTYFLKPLASWTSRRHEFEADQFAAQQVNAGSMIAALVKLYRENASNLTPDPVYSRFYDSHPPAALRVARLQSLS